MPISHTVRAKKIKGIIAANIHQGEQACADKINQGGFPPPGHTTKWGPEHIGPMMAGEISLKPVRKRDSYIGAVIDRDMLDIIYRNSVSNSAFLRCAISEKIAREGLK